MHRFLLSLFFVMALFSEIKGFSSGEDTPEQELNTQLILELLDVKDPSILRVEEGKIFVQHDKVFLTDQGLFLKTSGLEVRKRFISQVEHKGRAEGGGFERGLLYKGEFRNAKINHFFF